MSSVDLLDIMGTLKIPKITYQPDMICPDYPPQRFFEHCSRSNLYPMFLWKSVIPVAMEKTAVLNPGRGVPESEIIIRSFVAF